MKIPWVPLNVPWEAFKHLDPRISNEDTFSSCQWNWLQPPPLPPCLEKKDLEGGKGDDLPDPLVRGTDPDPSSI
jgi:hypothetical protein